jgi:hypothetical protein
MNARNYFLNCLLPTVFANTFIFQIVKVETNFLPEISISEFSHSLARPMSTDIALQPNVRFSNRSRDEDYSPPPAQIPAGAANAPGSSLGSNAGDTRFETACTPAHSRQSNRRGVSAQCPNHGRLSAVSLPSWPSDRSVCSSGRLASRLGTTPLWVCQAQASRGPPPRVENFF